MERIIVNLFIGMI